MLVSLVLASVLLVIWHVWVYGPTDPSVSSAVSPKPYIILLGSEIWDLIFGKSGILAELKNISLYFLAGVLLAGFIRTFKLAIKLRNSLIHHGFLSIFIASLVGVLTPLCSCGILSTAITLLFAGVPLAPVMALLVSSPLISPSAYLLTLSDLGPHWTIVRVSAAFLMGIFAGVITHLIRNRGFNTDPLFLEGAVPEGDFHDSDYPEEKLKCNCKEKFGNRIASGTDNKFVIFWAKSSDMLWMVGKYVLVGISMGAVVERYMPSEWIYRLFGQEGRLSIVWITLGTIPVFLHQISASSILYHIKSTLDGTMSGGAGLAFLIGGPVTAIPAMTMLWAMFKKRVFFLYMFISIAGTIILAYSFQYFVFVPYVDTGNPVLKGISSLSGGRSSIISRLDKNVRIVMDPGGKNIIATYHDYAGGKGGVVFDAGFERFLDASAEKYDNRRYIENIAVWLEESSGTATQGNILVYNTFHSSGLSTGGIPQILDSADGFKVRVTDREETPEILRGLLDEYSQFWIFFSEAGSDCCFTDDELEFIGNFVDSGGSLLIVAGQYDNSVNEKEYAANRVASMFGVRFYGLSENSEELDVSTLFHLFDRASAILGRMYRAMT